MEKRLIDRMIESRLAEKRKKQEEEAASEAAFHAYFEEQDRLGNFFEYSDIEKARESGDNELANYIQGLFDSSRQACLRFDKEDPRYGKMPEKVGPGGLLDRILVNADEETAPSNIKIETEQEEPPFNEYLEKLTQGKEPVLRKWNRGKYKCSSLARFVMEYVKLVDNLTPNLIRDYLVKEDGKPYSDKTIAKEIKTNGPGRRIRNTHRTFSGPF